MIGIGMLFKIVYGVLVVFSFVISLVWVYHDANRRGKAGWVIATVIGITMWPLGLLVWWIFRPEIQAPIQRRSGDYSQYDW